jgi:hypothetical protein
MISQVDEIADAVEAEKPAPEPPREVHLTCSCNEMVGLCGYEFRDGGVPAPNRSTNCMECVEIAMAVCPRCGVTFKQGTEPS